MRVDFYILPDQQTRQLQGFACKLTEKAWTQGHRIFVYTESDQQSRMMDELLWTFRDGSFVPHGLQGDSGTEQQPVVIGHQLPAPLDRDLVINLTTQLVDTPRMTRLAEIVNQEPVRKQASREHYRYFKSRQHELHHHDIHQT